MSRSKKNVIVTKNAHELTEFLGLDPHHAVEIEFSHELNNKIIDIVKKKQLTHAEVASLSGIGRTKITAIMNRSLMGISIKTLIRVLLGLGYRVYPKFSKAA